MKTLKMPLTCTKDFSKENKLYAASVQYISVPECLHYIVLHVTYSVDHECE